VVVSGGKAMSQQVDGGSGTGAIARTFWNDPKKLDAFVGIWAIGWVLVSFLILSFFLGLFPQNLVGSAETGLVIIAGYSPVVVVAYRRRRILRSARA
jgi:hypothetical protein